MTRQIAKLLFFVNSACGRERGRDLFFEKMQQRNGKKMDLISSSLRCKHVQLLKFSVFSPQEMAAHFYAY